MSPVFFDRFRDTKFASAYVERRRAKAQDLATQSWSQFFKGYAQMILLVAAGVALFALLLWLGNLVW